MAEYIEREALMEDCKCMIDEMWNRKTAPVSWAHAYAEFLDNVERIPAADVAPVVHGRMIETNRLIRDGKSIVYGWECTACKRFTRSPFVDSWNYCPNCGARMDGDSDG